MVESVSVIKKRIAVARHHEPADLVIRNGRVLNLFSGRVHEQDVAVSGGVIAALGKGYEGIRSEDAEGRWVVPGFIDAHIHIESSMLAPSSLSRALLPFGTTALVADPHEIANVRGLEGVDFMLENSDSIPFDIFFTAPSCVPATGLETSGASVGLEELRVLAGRQRVVGLAEMMNYPGVLGGDEGCLEKLACFDKGAVDGHCPALGGSDLQAYVAAGIGSDHESTGAEEAMEKVESGMMLFIREGSTARNLDALIPVAKEAYSGRFCLVSDDLNAEEIMRRGHLNYMLKRAVAAGLEPAAALRMVTINPASYFGLKKRGALIPGYRADIVLLDDMKDFSVSCVFKDGKKAAKDGLCIGFPEKQISIAGFGNALNTVHLNQEDFQIPIEGKKARIINLVPSQIETRTSIEEVPCKGGFVAPDMDGDVIFLFVVERHHATGRIGKGLVRGLGLKKGAVATSVAHDSHNIIAAGTGFREVLRAVQRVSGMGGGIALDGGEGIVAELALPLAGLMTDEPVERVAERLGSIRHAMAGLGCRLEEPLMALSFLALPVIPELKLTDHGLVDVLQFKVVPLFAE